MGPQDICRQNRRPWIVRADIGIRNERNRRERICIFPRYADGRCTRDWGVACVRAISPKASGTARPETDPHVSVGVVGRDLYGRHHLHSKARRTGLTLSEEISAADEECHHENGDLPGSTQFAAHAEAPSHRVLPPVDESRRHFPFLIPVEGSWRNPGTLNGQLLQSLQPAPSNAPNGLVCRCPASSHESLVSTSLEPASRLAA